MKTIKAKWILLLLIIVFGSFGIIMLLHSKASENGSDTVRNDYREQELKRALERGMNDLDGFTISFSFVSEKGCILVYSNQTPQTCEYGRDYYLYRYNETKGWEPVDFIRDEAVYMDALLLKSGEEIKISRDFEYRYGKLAPGKYLHLVSISTTTDRKTYTEYYYGNEFEIP